MPSGSRINIKNYATKRKIGGLTVLRKKAHSNRKKQTGKNVYRSINELSATISEKTYPIRMVYIITERSILSGEQITHTNTNHHSKSDYLCGKTC
jgi:hypothetical protein